MKFHKVSSVLMALALTSATANAATADRGLDQRSDPAIPNWEAPLKWTPPEPLQDKETAMQDAAAAAAMGLRSTLVVAPPPTPLTFVPMTPCRIVDTRGNGQTGAFGTPQMNANTSRTIPVPTHPTCTGIPATAGAYSLNITVTNTGSGSFGYLQVWPTGQSQPTSSTLNYPGAGATLANAAVVPAGTSGSIDLFSGNASADVIIDINGYYGPTGSLPSFTGYNSFLKTANADYFFPTGASITMPKGGACLVMANSQYIHGTVPTTTGPYFRIAIQRGAALPDNDSLFGFYAQPGLTRSPDMNRHAVIPINANETTLLGCFFSATGDANWQTTVYCRVSFVCY
jgi:hypothetical protein